MRRLLARVLLVCVPLVACGAQGGPADAAASARVRLTRVGRAASPVGIVARPGDARLYVVEQGGTIRPLTATGGAAPVLDVRDEVSSGGEQGLLGLAFSPDGTKLYVNLTNLDGDTEVREYAWRNGAADPASRRLLLHVEQPYANHNGGSLQVSPDGVLWVGLGDGGSGGDPHGYGQNVRSLLGKILRIDPRPEGERPYRIPAGNAFTADGGRPEIWAVGLRNPWRFFLDVPGGNVWIADVGQNAWEEIDVVPLGRTGANFGWNRREGRHEFEGARPAGNVEPVHEYSHSGGNCSVTGGAVYRGARIPALTGAYLFGDYCGGQVQALRRQGNAWRATRLGLEVEQLTSFGVDRAGEVYVASGAGSVYRLDPR